MILQHPLSPLPSYDEISPDGTRIFDIFQNLGCLKAAFDGIIDDLKEAPPDVTKIQKIPILSEN